MRKRPYWCGILVRRPEDCLTAHHCQTGCRAAGARSERLDTKSEYWQQAEAKWDEGLAPPHLGPTRGIWKIQIDMIRCAVGVCVACRTTAVHGVVKQIKA